MSVSSIPTHLKTATDNGNEEKSGISRLIGQEVSDLKSFDLWRAAVAEFVGTLLLCVFTIGVGLKKEGAEEGPSLLQIAIGCGFFIGLIITILNNVSGGHVNPAISIGFFLTGQITFVRFIIFSIFHTLGAIAGSGLLRTMIPKDFVGNLGLISPAEGVSTSEAMKAEVLVTFFLLFSVIAMVDDGRKDIQGSVPFMVGITVTVNILYGPNFSGGCMNPIRNTGPAVILGKYDDLWIYWAGPMLGATIGTLLYDFLLSTQPFSFRRRFHVNREFNSETEVNGDVLRQALLDKQLEDSPESKV